MKTEFEIFADRHGLNILKIKGEFVDGDTFYAKLFWDAQQVKIDKLEHDLASEKCANRMLTHVLDNATKARTA